MLNETEEVVCATSRIWPETDRGVVIGGYYCAAVSHPWRLDVVVYKIFGQDQDGALQFFEEDMGCGPTSDLTKAEKFLEGSVKWDGCSDLSFNDSRCALHFCSKEQMVEVGVLLGRLYDLAADLVPNWNP